MSQRKRARALKHRHRSLREIYRQRLAHPHPATSRLWSEALYRAAGLP